MLFFFVKEILCHIKNFTDEEVERAGSVDLVSFFQNQGESLKREGKSYAWMDNE